jgi:single-stranded-DNA-specific exonuclease
MSHARDAYHLLVTEDLVEAEAAAAHLQNKNEERRGAVDQIFATARERLKSIFATRVLPPVLVLGDPAWSPAVAGLAASRLVEEFDRPAFVWGHNGQGEVKGSCRSNGTVNMVELMRRAHEREALFANYGGHAMAGGFSLPRERLEGLPESLCWAHEEVAKAAAEGELLIDAEWPAHLATAEVYRELERLSPFGVGNAKPLFLFRNLELVTARLFGKTGAHQEFQFNNLAPRVIAFFYRLPASLRGEPGERVDLAASLEKSFFRGRPELRLRLVDLRPAAC